MEAVGRCMFPTLRATRSSFLSKRIGYVPPHATTALDLSQSEELIRQQTQDLAQQTPGSKSWSVWRQEFQRQMDLSDKQ